MSCCIVFGVFAKVSMYVETRNILFGVFVKMSTYVELLICGFV